MCCCSTIEGTLVHVRWIDGFIGVLSRPPWQMTTMPGRQTSRVLMYCVSPIVFIGYKLGHAGRPSSFCQTSTGIKNCSGARFLALSLQYSPRERSKNGKEEN